MNTWTRITCCTVVALLAQSFLSQAVMAQEDDNAALLGIVDAVEKGWEQADGTP